jgi:hypothetical protein
VGFSPGITTLPVRSPFISPTSISRRKRFRTPFAKRRRSRKISNSIGQSSRSIVGRGRKRRRRRRKRRRSWWTWAPQKITCV